MRTMILVALVLVGCGDTPDKDSPNNDASNTPNNTSNSTNNGTTGTTNSGSCAFDTDCELGAVCSVDNECIVADCEFCTADQICYRAEPADPGSCSAPECQNDDDCGEMMCRSGVCGEGCTSNADCDEGEICNLAGECVAE